MNIPMSSPDITQREIDAVMRVLQSRHLSLGPYLDAFEQHAAAALGASHGIAVNSGTSGLHLAMIACGIQEGDEVITTSFSFVASANAIVYERGTPVFVDIDPLTGNIDPTQIEAAITERTRAILVVDVFGQPADIDPIAAIARKHGLYLIQDSCEAIGSQYKGKPVGSSADAAVYAFYPNKQMTTGEGGLILTNRDDWNVIFRSLRNQGRDIFNTWLQHNRLGYNYRMDEMSAALGLSQLERLDEMLDKRAQVAAWYTQRIEQIPHLTPPVIVPTTTRMSWFVYVIRCEAPIVRDQLMQYLHEQGIPSRCYFSPIHQQPFYQQQTNCRYTDLYHTERAGETFLALPFSSVMDEQQVDFVCKHLYEGVQVLTQQAKQANGAIQ